MGIAETVDGGKVALVEPPGAVGDKTDGELKPLALVHRHDAHCRGVFGEDVGALEIPVCLLRGVDVAQEAGESPSAPPLVARRIAEQQPEIGELLLA